MDLNKYLYSEKEQKEILKNLTILIDTREKENTHILSWFDKNNIKYEKQKLEFGDYSFKISKNEEFGIIRNIYYIDSICVERKANIDEIINNFSNDRDRLESELLRNKGNMILVIEDGSYNDIRNGNYKSKYNSKSAIGTLHSFSTRYNVPFIFINKEDTGCYIYCTFYYYLRNIIN